MAHFPVRKLLDYRRVIIDNPQWIDYQQRSNVLSPIPLVKNYRAQYVGSLVGWLVVWLVGWLVERLTAVAVVHRHNLHQQISGSAPETS